MSVRLPPIGFWSYARHDDEADQRLTHLRGLLSQQLQMQYGRERIKLFQDVGAIPPGAEWETQIREALNHSAFFVPLITPNFVQSEWCNTEFFAFRERELDLERQYPNTRGKRRIFPIYYVDIEGIDAVEPKLIPELRRLQWLDFRDLIFVDPSQQSVQFALSKLARSVRDLLLTPLEEASPRGSAAALAAQPEAATPSRAGQHPSAAEDNVAGGVRPPRKPANLPMPALAAGGGLIVAVLLAALFILHPARPTATARVTSPASAAPAESSRVAPERAPSDPAAALLGHWNVASLGCVVAFARETDGSLSKTFDGASVDVAQAPSPAAGVLAFRADDGVRFDLRDGALSMTPSGATRAVRLTRCSG